MSQTANVEASPPLSKAKTVTEVNLSPLTIGGRSGVSVVKGCPPASRPENLKIPVMALDPDAWNSDTRATVGRAGKLKTRKWNVLSPGTVNHCQLAPMMVDTTSSPLGSQAGGTKLARS